MSTSPVPPTESPTAVPTDALDQSVNAPKHSSSRVDITEKPALAAGSGPALLIVGGAAADAGEPGAVLGIVAGSVGLLIASPLFSSFTIVVPGQTSVRQFLGRYIGTVRHTGLVLVPPLTSGRRVSIKVHNFETHELKVNDLDGNPVNIAAIVVWQVADTARAVFAVEAYEQFIRAQAESALRHVATTHPYDEAMLQRQQADAIIAAREQIVEGAVTMVDQALKRLEADDIVTMDEERRAQMVSNLLVVLCSDQRTQPVVNTGSLYA